MATNPGFGDQTASSILQWLAGPMGTLLNDVLGLGATTYGGLLSKQSQDWFRRALGTGLGLSQTEAQYGRDRYQQLFDPLYSQFQNVNLPWAQMWGAGADSIPALMQQASGWQGGLPALQRNMGQYMTPQMQQAFSRMMGYAGGLDPMAALALQGMQGQGAQMGEMGNFGMGMLGNQGQTAFTQALIGRGGEAGQGLLGAGQGALAGQFGEGGLTGTGATGEGVALEGLLRGGQTPFTNYLQQRGAQMAGQQSLMPFGDYLSMARNEAANAINQQALRAQAQQRMYGLGGPGAIGQVEARMGPMAEFADEAAKAQAAATTGAARDYQNLLLQQAGLGSQMALGAGSQEQARLATMGSLLGGLENVASGRFATGGGMLQDILQGALGGGQQEIARMGLGGNLLNQYNQLRLGFGGLGGQLAGTQGSLMNEFLGQQLGAGQLDATRFAQIANAMNQMYGTRSGMFQWPSSQWLGALDPWTRALVGAGGMYESGINAFMSPFGGAMAGALRQPSLSQILIGSGYGASRPGVSIGGRPSTGGTAGGGGSNLPPFQFPRAPSTPDMSPYPGYENPFPGTYPTGAPWPEPTPMPEPGIPPGTVDTGVYYPGGAGDPSNTPSSVPPQEGPIGENYPGEALGYPPDYGMGTNFGNLGFNNPY